MPKILLTFSSNPSMDYLNPINRFSPDKVVQPGLVPVRGNSESTPSATTGDRCLKAKALGLSS